MPINNDGRQIRKCFIENNKKGPRMSQLYVLESDCAVIVLSYNLYPSTYSQATTLSHDQPPTTR